MCVFVLSCVRNNFSANYSKVSLEVILHERSLMKLTNCSYVNRVYEFVSI